MGSKAQLRQQCRDWRSALSASWRKEASLRLCQRLVDQLVMPPSSIIAGYAAIRGEPDIMPALQTWAAAGHRLALPCIVGKAAPLLFRCWKPDETLMPARFGIDEPAPHSPPCRPTVYLVPMLAFDTAGHRLGYGAGYYDRSFAAVENKRSFAATEDNPGFVAREEGVETGGDALRIGICWEGLKQPHIPVDAHDWRMDAVVTEEHFYRFSTPR